MTEQIKTRRTAAEELAEIVFADKESTEERIPFKIGSSQYAAEFIDSPNSLTAGIWDYSGASGLRDIPETFKGAIRFSKNSDETNVRYGQEDIKGIKAISADVPINQPASPGDLEFFQPYIEAALQKLINSQAEQRAEIEGDNDPVSNRVIKIVDAGSDKYKMETGIYMRQTHSKDGTHYVAAYNPHKGKDLPAECFLNAAERFGWIAADGPSAEDIDKVNSILDAFEALLGQDG